MRENRKNNNIDRRAFLKRSAVFAMAVSMPAFSCKEDNTNTPEMNNCNTTADILGPFYKPGAPFREDITPSENTGAPLFIQGKVFSDCDKILPEAVVEIWNADLEGVYDNTTFKFRGQFKTENEGLYRFKTIIPGRYLNGNTYRPSHIHFRINASGYQELVSQIYFKDDPFIPGDPWAGSPGASQRILTVGSDENGIDTVTFDIYLVRQA